VSAESASGGRRHLAKRALVALLVGAVGVAAITLRVVVAGELEIAASTDALLAGDPRAATTHAKAAATWYAPGAPHVRVAYERLMALGDAAAERQNREIALLAYRAVRSASESTRWIVVPHEADARRAAEAIARIESSAPRPPATSLEPQQVVEKRQLDDLARRTSPRTSLVIVLAASFLAWVVGLASILLRAIDESGKIAWSRATVGVAVGVAGLVGWVVALWLA
jgi:hypothetical protein